MSEWLAIPFCWATVQPGIHTFKRFPTFNGVVRTSFRCYEVMSSAGVSARSNNLWFNMIAATRVEIMSETCDIWRKLLAAHYGPKCASNRDLCRRIVLFIFEYILFRFACDVAHFCHENQLFRVSECKGFSSDKTRSIVFIGIQINLETLLMSRVSQCISLAGSYEEFRY